MTDEEKEAIDYFYNIRKSTDESIMLYDKDMNLKCGKTTIKNITLILNLIQKQQKEIEKKDKMIDEMLDVITKVYSDDEKIEFIANLNIQERKKEAKQYFKKKAEEE